MSRATFTAFALVFLAVGAAMGRLALRHFARRRELVANSALTDGVVTGHAEERSADTNRRSYFPEIEFRLSTGQLVRFRGAAGREDEPAHAVGARVRVRYRTNGPPDAELDEFSSLWGPALLFGALALAFLAIGAAMLMGWIPA
jgi:hypothetical protein